MVTCEIYFQYAPDDLCCHSIKARLPIIPRIGDTILFTEDTLNRLDKDAQRLCKYDAEEFEKFRVDKKRYRPYNRTFDFEYCNYVCNVSLEEDESIVHVALCHKPKTK